MSKVLVDQEWLKRLHRDLDACQKVIWLGLRGADPAYCQDAQDRLKEIDELLAQPAEAEGSIQCPASHPAECYALGTHVVHASLVHGIVRQADELNAALSAVTAELTAADIAYRIRGDVIAELTAERDRLRDEKGDPAGSFEKCMQAMRDRDEHAKTIDHLRAEVETLRKDAERYRWLRNPDQDVALVLDKVTGEIPVDKFGCGGYRTYEYRAGVELDDAIDAAMAAKEA